MSVPFPVCLIGNHLGPSREGSFSRRRTPAPIGTVGRVDGASAPKASAPKCVVGKNRSWWIPLPQVREAQAASGLPAPHFCRAFLQRGPGFTCRSLMGDTTKVNREVGGFDRAQTMSRFIRGMWAGNQRFLLFGSRFVRGVLCSFLLLFPDPSGWRADLSSVPRRLHRNYERIRPGVRRNRDACANESGCSALVE